MACLDRSLAIGTSPRLSDNPYKHFPSTLFTFFAMATHLLDASDNQTICPVASCRIVYLNSVPPLRGYFPKTVYVQKRKINTAIKNETYFANVHFRQVRAQELIRVHVC